MSEQELDQLLDAALPGYLAEAPSGLQERVLARVRRPLVWPWAAGLAAAAALALVFLLPRPTAIEALPLTVAHAPSAPAVQLTPVPVEAKRRVGAYSLSRPERILVAFAQAHPNLAQQVLVEAPKRMDEPLTLQPLTIQPITIEPLDTGGE
ncbi:MAG: hypothetical protein ABI972_11230 [Acidobacteriota bacterium]